MLRYLLLAVLVANGVNGDTNYRLNTPLYPTSYAISITPYFETGDDTAFTFDGEVTINFRTNNITNQIKLHSENLTFTAANITLSSGSKAVTLNDALPLGFDTKYTFAFINVQNDLQVDTDYSLKIVYRGPIRSDLNGFYRNYYIEDGVKKWLGTTQMAPTHARKVFPCFDEPELKAVFTLTIDRPANYRPSLSNTKLQSTTNLSNGMVREVFSPTPRMPTYLVAFLVSQFEAARYSVEGAKEFGVFTRPDAANHSEYAFDFGKRVVTALGDYFGIDYYSTDSNLKLDHVALPDFEAGAMENWGLIKYRESLLLYVPEDSTPYFKYRVAQVVAHETTHMWFGDLVTCHWWSDTWLNEGFANYFQDYITALIEPEVGSADQLVIGSVYSAYDYGEASESSPISNDEVNSPAEISAHFGAVSYQKAGSVIRMIHHLLGNEAFMFGLNLYLNTNKFGPGYPEKLYSALEQGVDHTNALSEYPGATLTNVMSSWITQPGHPILHVDVNYDNNTITLTQKRFFLNSSQSSNEIYKIPITYTTEMFPDFNDTKPKFIMMDTMHQFVVPNISDTHSWILFNVQETGLYRVNYDEHSWEIITSALKSDQRENIHYINRAKIVNDLFALFYADEVSFSRLYDTLDFLENETNYAVWYAAIRGFNKLRNSFLGTDVVTEIETFALKHLNNIMNKLGYQVSTEEGTVELRNRMQVLEFACKLGHDGCLTTAGELFKQLTLDGVEVSPSLRPMVYCYGLHQGDGEDYEFLWRRMNTTNVANEVWVIADALGCTSVEEKKKKYLVSMLEENSPIRTQDLTTPLTSILAHYENVHFVIHQLQDNYDAWVKIYGTMDTVLSTIASSLRSPSDFSEFEQWLSSCSQCTEQAVVSTKDALKTARASSAWAEGHRASVLGSLKSYSPVTLPSLMVILGLGFGATAFGLVV